ncbi:MAG: murein L,D-transpeptidase catalytic domain family protein [Sphingomonadaceae bacterium]|nr:murein L,D-transpeptidase catalytic domain family protein [Sphingomonadaceae bacterium]
MTGKFLIFAMALTAFPAFAQEGAVVPVNPAPQGQAGVVFQTGTGNGSPTASPIYVKPPRPEIGCDTLALAGRAVSYGFYNAFETPRHRLDAKLFQTALDKYRGYYCNYGRTRGPAVIVVVDFAKHSSEPRLYRVDLRSGDGLDSPMRVAHGIGSDPDDDGYATVFSNVYNSFASSLGAAIGAERYVGQNGLSLRLDGLEPSNNQMRMRDIVVHSYAPERRRYFNADLVSTRGRPGSSEGCFVVEPDKREWILETLENGGFIYAGFSGELPRPIVPVANGNIVFASGTGSNPPSALQPVSETLSGMPDSPPTAPISPAPTTSTR